MKIIIFVFRNWQTEGVEFMVGKAEEEEEDMRPAAHIILGDTAVGQQQLTGDATDASQGE